MKIEGSLYIIVVTGNSYSSNYLLCSNKKDVTVRVKPGKQGRQTYMNAHYTTHDGMKIESNAKIHSDFSAFAIISF